MSTAEKTIFLLKNKYLNKLVIRTSYIVSNYDLISYENSCYIFKITYRNIDKPDEVEVLTYNQLLSTLVSSDIFIGVEKLDKIYNLYLLNNML